MLQPLRFVLLLSIVLAAAAQPSAMPPWRPGVMDIHHISTGRGNATLFVLPDATTLLVDVGETGRRGARVFAVRPNDSKSPGEWISDYIRHVLRPIREVGLDYVFLTHFDGDHMGSVVPEARKSDSGKYVRSGVTEVATSIPTGTIIDRGWPDYNYPRDTVKQRLTNYLAFLEEFRAKGGKVEQASPGSIRQIAPRRSSDKVQIRVLAANGRVWSGRGDDAVAHFPPLESLDEADYPTENTCSAALRIQYGGFTYFVGGDINGELMPGLPEWWDIETPLAKVIGRIDVHQVNHHAYFDGANATFLRAMEPSVHIISSWDPTHPSITTLQRLLSKRIYRRDRHIYSTATAESTRLMLENGVSQFMSQDGHIVIRVAENGDTYDIYVLDDASEQRPLKARFGPYCSYASKAAQCKEGPSVPGSGR